MLVENGVKTAILSQSFLGQFIIRQNVWLCRAYWSDLLRACPGPSGHGPAGPPWRTRRRCGRWPGRGPPRPARPPGSCCSGPCAAAAPAGDKGQRSSGQQINHHLPLLIVAHSRDIHVVMPIGHLFCVSCHLKRFWQHAIVLGFRLIAGLQLIQSTVHPINTDVSSPHTHTHTLSHGF